MKIVTEDIAKIYNQKKVLTSVSLDVEEGKINVILGPNGSGKTTLLKIMNLLERPDAGRLLYNGEECSYSSDSGRRLELSRQMTMVMQNPTMFDATVFQNVAYGLKVRGEKKRFMRQRAESALDMVRMTQARERRALTLSGGEAQRVALARALVLNPEVIFLDEPTNNLDSISLRIIEDLILRLKEEKDTTLVLTTHLLSNARKWGERFFVLREGKVIQKGSRKEVFERPTSVFWANFIGMENFLSGKLIREKEQVKLEVDGVRLDVVSDREGDAYASIPPEDILISLMPLSSSARNCFRGKVARIEEEGAIVRIKVDIGIPLTSIVTKRSKEEMNLAEGREMYVTFKASAVHLFQGDQI
ncbi:MAG: ABC transporter ATP-binding protein [Candidatus Zixiibacteriota bacterium]